MKMKWFYNKKISIEADRSDLSEVCVGFIEDALTELGTDRKLIIRTMLTAEEVITRLAAHTDEGEMIHICVRRFFGDAGTVISSKGEEFDISGESLEMSDEIFRMGDEDAERAIRSIMLNSLGDQYKHSYRNGENSIRIMTGQADRSMLRRTVAALIIGALFGLMLNAAPDALSGGVCDYVLGPVKTMFMSALKMVIAPVVFFSIVSCIAQYRNISELGRIGAKVMGMYLLTTVTAILISLGFSLLLHPGKPGFALGMSGDIAAVDISTDVDTSILHTIINIVPSNFLKPFLESDTIQIIFLGVLVGLAVGMLGEYTPLLQEFFAACNSLFLTVTTIITRMIPAAVFCSIVLMIVQMGGASFLSLLGMIGTYILCVICMLTTYGILILVLGRLSPFVFFRKNREGMLTSFTLSSSSAAMPINMKTCTDKLGISPKVCSFSIPLGATVNMDGMCITLTVAGLFLARAYGVSVHGSMFFSLMITIILLSLGAPGVPGSGLVCLGVVLGSLGVPVEAIGLIIGIYPFIDMANTISNTTGDVAAATVVAGSEGLLDRDVYYDMTKC